GRRPRLPAAVRGAARGDREHHAARPGGLAVGPAEGAGPRTGAIWGSDPLAAQRRELGPAIHAGDQRPRPGDRLGHAGRAQRRVVRLAVGPRLGHPDRVLVLPAAHDVEEAALIGPQGVGRLQQDLRERRPLAGLRLEAAVHPKHAPDTSTVRRMGLTWVLFNLTGTLVDPTVLAQPLGDSGADEELVLSALDDTVAMAMVDQLTGGSSSLN